MEIAVGQYSGRGPTVIGDMVPIGKGVESPAVILCLVFFSCLYLRNITLPLTSHRVYVSVRFVLYRRSGGHGLHLFFKRYLL